MNEYSCYLLCALGGVVIRFRGADTWLCSLCDNICILRIYIKSINIQKNFKFFRYFSLFVVFMLVFLLCLGILLKFSWFLWKHCWQLLCIMNNMGKAYTLNALQIILRVRNSIFCLWYSKSRKPKDNNKEKTIQGKRLLPSLYNVFTILWLHFGLGFVNLKTNVKFSRFLVPRPLSVYICMYVSLTLAYTRKVYFSMHPSLEKYHYIAQVLQKL